MSFLDTGFTIAFAVLPNQIVPQQIRNDKDDAFIYNCSGPAFPLFSHVLNCNMRQECINGEDEDDKRCRYLTKECGPDSVDVGHKCLTLHQVLTFSFKYN